MTTSPRQLDWNLYRLVAVSIWWTLALAASDRLLAQQTSETWPGFLGPARNGKTTASSIKTDWRRGNLTVQWQIDVGDGYGIGSADRNAVYQFDRVGASARLRKIDLKTGELLWTFSYPTEYVDKYGYDGGPRASPLIDGDFVYIFGAEGMLHCLHRESGKRQWQVNTTEQFNVQQNFFGVGSSPIVHNQLLIVMTGGSPADADSERRGPLDRVEPDDCAIVAFHKVTGEVVYTTGDDLASYSTPVVTTMHNQPIGLAFCRSGLLGFDPGTGDRRFHFPWKARKLESVNAATPLALDANRVFITESYGPGGAVLQLDEQFQPRVIWSDARKREQSLAAHWATPIEVDGYLYGCHGQHRGSAELRCVDASNGEVCWSQPGLQRTNLTGVNGYLIGITESGRLMLIRATPDKFDLVTEFEPAADTGEAFTRLRYPCWSAPVIANGKLLVRSAGKLTCFQLAD